MVTRRRFLQGSAATALTLLGTRLSLPAAFAASRKLSSQPATQPGNRLTRHVDVTIGTGGHGHTYPGASMPFGMVQLSPDTYNQGWDACSGYHLGDGSIMGFSHTHLSGTGAADLLDVLVMPAQGKVRLEPGARSRPDINYRSDYDLAPVPGQPQQLPVDATITHGRGYRQSFDRSEEQARPGYYRVRLKDHDIVAELTATERTGLHRYTFNKSGKGHLLIDLAHGQNRNAQTPCRVSDALLQVIGTDTLVGSRHVHEWANGRHIYFAMKVSRPFVRAELYNENRHQGSLSETRGTHLKAALHFDDVGHAPLLVKVGISGVDIQGALRNLESEQPDWAFDQLVEQADAAWNRELGRIQINAPTDEMRTIFYTSLYHTMLAPTLFDDVDGRYRGMDLKVHTLASGEHNYSTYSLWDTYRALHPLFTLYQPERVPALVNGLIRMAAESPDGPPVWPLQGVETGCMIGYHSSSVIAEAQAKGFTGIDIDKAWPLFRQRAMDDDYRGLPYYRKLGYIPSDMENEAVSKTLEYCYDDWAVAQIADAAGAHGDATRLRERSRNYRNVFDHDVGFMRPRDQAGQWLEQPFDPNAIAHSNQWRDFTESNSWQATFLNQHDLYGYMQLFGGEAGFESKLDGLFNAPQSLPGNAPPDIAGLVGQYAHGNEPSHHIAYLYAYTGAHHKTQARVRMLLDTMYRAQPDGLAGNEDCGQMSAWYVMGALGLYAVDPVSTHYVFGSPLLDRAEIAIGGGRSLVVETKGNSEHTPYIQSVQRNGLPWTKSWISHAELMKGGILSFNMGSTPNPTFGEARADRPPSFGQPATAQA